MIKVVTVVGARPQFIKAAVVSRLLAQDANFQECLVHTGQHYDATMSDIFFEELELPRPQHHLQVGSGTHADQTAAMLVALDPILRQVRPDIVLVYGDTNSTLAGALAAAKLGFRVGHVEAGLRSFDRSMPEEINRIVTDHLAHWFFVPTTVAVSNLQTEGITDNVYLVGDVMQDAVLYYGGHGRATSSTLQSLNLAGHPYLLATIHRAANTDDETRLGQIWQALNTLSQKMPVVLPLHPRTRHVIARLGWSPERNLHLVEPVGYREMLELTRGSRLVLTDSGGLQKEAYMLKVPCVTLRDNTEWVETVQTGWNRLAGANVDHILSATRHFYQEGPPAERPPLYGCGDAAQKIVKTLLAA